MFEGIHKVVAFYKNTYSIHLFYYLCVFESRIRFGKQKTNGIIISCLPAWCSYDIRNASPYSRAVVHLLYRRYANKGFKLQPNNFIFLKTGSSCSGNSPKAQRYLFFLVAMVTLLLQDSSLGNGIVFGVCFLTFTFMSAANSTLKKKLWSVQVFTTEDVSSSKCFYSNI